MTVPPTPARLHPLIPALVGFVLVIAMATGVAIAAYVGFRLFQRGTEIPAMLDSGTHAYFTFTPNLKDVPHIERLNEAFPEFVSEGEDGYTAAIDKFLTDTLDMTFEEDIASWVGTEVGIAFTFDEQFMDEFGSLANDPSPRPFEEAIEIGEAYWIIQSRDDTQLNEFITNFRARVEEDGDEITTTEYNNVTIYQFRIDDTEVAPYFDIAFANIKGHLVITNHPEGIPLMIDRQEQDSLAALPTFQRIKNNIPDSALAYAFYNGSFYQEFWASFTESMPAGATMPALQTAQESIEALEAGGIALTVEEHGLRFEMITAMDTTVLSQDTRRQYEESQATVGDDLSALVGDEAIMMANWRLPRTYRDQLMEALETNPETQESLESFEAETGISVEEDILSWLVGDMVLTVLPGIDELLPVSGYLRLRSENPEEAKAGMEKLVEALLQGAPESPFESRMIEGVDWMVLPDPSDTDTLYGGYAFVENDVILAVGGPAITETGERGNALLESDTYRAATQGLPENNTGVFYLNIQDTVALIDKLSPEILDEDVKTRIAPFVAIAGAREAGIPEDGLMRAEFFIYIAAPDTE